MSIARMMQQAAAGSIGEIDSFTVNGTINSNGFSGSSYETPLTISVGALTTTLVRYNVVVEGGGALATNVDISSTVQIGTASPIVSCSLAVGQLPTSTSYKQWCGVHYGNNQESLNASRDVVITTNDSRTRSYGAQVYAVYVPQGHVLSVYDTASDFGSTSMSISLNTPPQNSLIVAGAAFRNGEATPSISFGGTAGLTTDFRVDSSGGDENVYSGSKLQSASDTLTVSIEDASAAGAESVLVGAVFYATRA